MAAVFIDSTKIEANANKYSFVWKKNTEKKFGKVQAKIHEALPEILKKLGIRFYVPAEIEIRHLKKLRNKLYAKIKEAGVVMVHGKGQRKTQLQRVLKQVEAWPNSGSIPMTCISAGTGTATAKPIMTQPSCT